MTDSFFLKKALTLAKRASGWTNPNPLVGAMIVKDGKIISRGFHRKVGLPHAEIEALQKAKENVEGATLYLNLEPCSHYGRTPPCVDEVIKSGITRVICSTLDPNPMVHGQGVKKLQNAGIDVSLGLLEKEARQLNETFFTFHEKKRPFIAMKFASSLDGKIATREGHSQWITNASARTFSRSLRGQYQAILVGIGTVLQDDPHLGVRMRGKKDPIRIILDSTLKISLKSQVLRDTNVIIATTNRADKKKSGYLKQKGITVLSFNSKLVPLDNLIGELTKRKIISVLIEGGGRVHGAFFDAGLVDKVYAFHAPLIIGGKNALNAVGGKGAADITDKLRLHYVKYKKFDNAMLTTGYTYDPFL